MRYVLCLWSITLSIQAAEPTAADLLVHRQGTVPIILSAPHGGRLPVPEVPVRMGLGIDKFVVVRDDGTAELTEKLAAILEKKLGKPYVVIARFERKYIDANRPASGAFESDKAKPLYDAYHDALQKACKEVKKDWGRGLLIDVHGQAADATAIYRGTQNLRTVKALKERFGKPAISGPNSVLGHLAGQGVKVVPGIDSDDAEDKRFNGGHIVQTYGSHDGYAIDAIQLELGSQFRQQKGRDGASEKLASAIEAFAKEYLPKVKQK